MRCAFRNVAAITFSIGLAVAQTPSDQGKAGMMGGGNGMMAKGMMSSGMGMTGSGMGMTADPVRASVFTAFALPDMQTELGFSAQQVTQLRQLKQGMLTSGQEVSRQIAAKRKDLEGAIGAGGSRNAEVKQLLEQMATLRAQLQFAAFETAGKMKAVLTDQQRTKLAAMKPAELHQAIMSHMTMRDMGEMMRFMGADGAMMRRGMMGMMGMMDGGMMGQGMMER